MGGGGSPSSTTSNTTATPWEGQQPSLLQQFGTAQGLFYGAPQAAPPNADGTPATNPDGSATTTPGAFMGGAYNPTYFPGSGAAPAQTTVAGFNPQEQAGLQQILGVQPNTQGYLYGAAGSSQGLMDKGFLTSNPGNGLYGQVAAAAPNNPAAGLFGNLSQSAQANPASGTLGATAAEGQLGNADLGMYASGAMLGSQNPAWKQLSDSVSASVLPQIQKQFIDGGGLASPQAAYASSQGLSSALAPAAAAWAQQQTANQMGAGSTLAQLGVNAAGTQGSLYNTGQGNAIAAGQGLSTAYQGALAEQLAAAQGVSGNYTNAANTQLGAINAAPGVANALTTNSQIPFQVGQAQQAQSQQELNAQIGQWNYNQNLPLNMLNAFSSAISGNYGGSTSLTQPYFTNPVGNALGVASSSAGLANGLFGSGGLFASGA